MRSRGLTVAMALALAPAAGAFLQQTGFAARGKRVLQPHGCTSSDLERCAEALLADGRGRLSEQVRLVELSPTERGVELAEAVEGGTELVRVSSALFVTATKGRYGVRIARAGLARALLGTDVPTLSVISTAGEPGQAPRYRRRELCAEGGKPRKVKGVAWTLHWTSPLCWKRSSRILPYGCVLL